MPRGLGQKQRFSIVEDSRVGYTRRWIGAQRVSTLTLSPRPRGRGESLDDMKRPPLRYQQLATEVSRRLPQDWMWAGLADNRSRISWDVALTEDVHLTPHGCVIMASATVERFDTIECWTVTLHRRVLDELSDRAVRWVIARELGYVAARRAASRVTSAQANPASPAPIRPPCERHAELCAINWGFLDEKKAYDQEVSLL